MQWESDDGEEEEMDYSKFFENGVLYETREAAGDAAKDIALSLGFEMVKGSYKKNVVK